MYLGKGFPHGVENTHSGTDISLDGFRRMHVHDDASGDSLKESNILTVKFLCKAKLVIRCFVFGASRFALKQKKEVENLIDAKQATDRVADKDLSGRLQECVGVCKHICALADVEVYMNKQMCKCVK